jgi:hypothetical protein
VGLYGGCFGLSRNVLHYFASKLVAGDAIGGGRWSGGRPLEKSAHLLVKLPGEMAFLSAIQTNLRGPPQISTADESRIIYYRSMQHNSEHIPNITWNIYKHTSFCTG